MSSSEHASFHPPLVSSSSSPSLDLSLSFSSAHSPCKYNSSVVFPASFTVALRIRPPLARELNGESKFVDVLRVDADKRGVTLTEPSESISHRFSFDYVFAHDTTQMHVYNVCAKPAVLSTLEGYNNTILAYGQTGTGKTYTMEGWSESLEFRGILPRVVEEVFLYIENEQVKNEKNGVNIFYTVKASYLQIYNEIVSDLLVSEQTSLQVREHAKGGVFVKNLSEWNVTSLKEVVNLIRKGSALRARASTRRNDESSRSHALFTLLVTQEDKKLGTTKVGKLNLVDLAGSERLRVLYSGREGAGKGGSVGGGEERGKRLKETTNINQSLSTLGNVICALVEKRTHIPYRDSKLTRILNDSLGGNCKTTLIALVSPSKEEIIETLSTLKFALRAKKIENCPTKNEFIDEHALLKQYELQVRNLKKDLESKSFSYASSSSSSASSPSASQSTERAGGKRVSDLEEQQRQTQADKNSLLLSVELLSAEIRAERARTLELEEKANNIAQTGDRIREMYQMRVAELEKEHAMAREGQSKYKHLMSKQRVILDQMTECLSEREHTITQLQQQLEASQKRKHEVEEAFAHLQLSVKTREESHVGTINILQKKVAQQTKEKIAVRMIFEQKLKRLVDNIANVALVAQALPNPTQLEIMVLQRLVDASIVALDAA